MIKFGQVGSTMAAVPEEKMFVSMRRYSPKNGAITRASLDLLRRQVHDDFLPRIQNISGFRGYYLVNIENREIVTLSIYDTADGLAQCAQYAAEYTLRNPLLYELGRPEITEGEVLVSGPDDASPVEVAGRAAATALALWYEESRAMLLSASER